MFGGWRQPPVDEKARTKSQIQSRPHPSEASLPSDSDEKKYKRRIYDYYLLMEFKKLKHLALPGLYVLPSADNIRRWHGVVFVRNGYYGPGIYKFIIDIPEAYPKEIPRILFTSKMFHPLINPTNGELDTSIEFATWNVKNSLAFLLSYVRKCFFKTDYWKPRPGKSAFNAKAEQLFASPDRSAFTKEAVECRRLSQQRQYVNDPQSSLRFTKIHSGQIEAAKRVIAKDAVPQGYLSWFTDGVNKLALPSSRELSTQDPSVISPSLPDSPGASDTSGTNGSKSSERFGSEPRDGSSMKTS